MWCVGFAAEDTRVGGDAECGGGNESAAVGDDKAAAERSEDHPAGAGQTPHST